MNNTLEGINNRVTEKEELISELKARLVEITEAKQCRNQNKKNETEMKLKRK